VFAFDFENGACYTVSAARIEAKVAPIVAPDVDTFLLYEIAGRLFALEYVLIGITESGPDPCRESNT